MPSTIVALLAERAESELRAMQSRLEAERARVEAERTRVEFELEQVAEALSRQSRAAAKPKSGRRPPRPGATQKRILDAVGRLPQPASPAEIIAEMEAHGPAGNRGTIHNAIARLVKQGVLDKPEVGQYKLASRNGSSGESNAGPSENEAKEPLSTAPQPQEVEHE